jgi:hypothetical protein
VIFVGHVFSVELPYGFDPHAFDVLDLEPDLDNIDWLEGDPQLPDGTASLFVHGRSTHAVELHLTDELEVWVPSLSSPANWEIAFAVLELATESLDTAFVTWNDGDLWELSELTAKCDDEWQHGQYTSDEQELFARVRVEGHALVKGPVRTTHFGPDTLHEILAGQCSAEDVILRTNYVSGPHLVAEAVLDSHAHSRIVTVIGPGLRTILPPADAVLLDTINPNQHPVMVPTSTLDQIGFLNVVRLDEAHRLVQAVPDSAWSAVLNAALPFAIT